MFRFKREQSVVNVSGVKFGGQPGELPTVLCGTIFYQGQKIVHNEELGAFDHEAAEVLICRQAELSEETGCPAVLHIYARTSEAFERYLDFAEQVWSGMRKHQKLFVRPMTDDDVKRLLELRIRRISAFDLEKSKEEEAEIDQKLREVAKKLGNIKATTIAYLKDLIARYGKAYPRRTRLGAFQEVDKKAVARPTLKLAYDPESGFVGTNVKGDQFPLAVTEFDQVLAVSDDGSYRIGPAPEKLLI
ncbi:MAG: hypothetical protein LUQ44_00125, partial [Methanothrix sp.]|nr:hypothetical protein [Methanothrix sp.]